ncbi:hypothetical protein [Pedobacter psychrodurus]|uniref:hypothetical protein n=1 Tax=Pedobacter psychrodurus TaxID=2530456 RepID=UPI00292CF84B|nr:hypothetical protein [Pedobacter psychrodurus]
MKRLFVVLVCTVMGFSTLTSMGKPQKPLFEKAPAGKAVGGDITSRRKTTAYIFHLTCGDVIVNVYNDAVNAPGVMSGIWNHLNDQNCK